MTDPLTAAPSFPNGDYEIDGVLGAGGMAVVYRARDLRRQRSVAIKVLRAELTHVTGSDRFRREIAVAASFAHPHIVPLLDLGEAIDALGRAVPFYVMPLIEGETLRDRLHRAPPVTLPEALRMTREVLGALHYAHQQGVIHRDIKPANVLLTGGHALVADFGVARALPGATGFQDTDSTITLSGLTVGTPAYMSPEQALGDKFIDERTDLYSTACVLYEMLTGHPPFAADSPSSIITLKLKGALPSVRSARPELPAALDDVLARALAPEPSLRFATAAAFVDALSTFDSGTHALTGASDRATARGDAPTSSAWTIPTWARRVPPASRSARPSFSPGAVVLAVSVAVGAVVAGVLALRDRTVAPVAPLAAVSLADRARVAVLPFELLDGDSTLAVMANGLTTDLIDELARFPAISVVSRNGVTPYVGGLIRTDSIARALDVGSVVTGDVRRVRDSVTVTVRLIDGASNTQVASVSATGLDRDVLPVRATLLDSVTTFLRRKIGEHVGPWSRRGTNNAEAWALLAQARGMIEGELNRPAALTARSRAARFALADSLLLRAATLDAQWSAPYVLSGRVMLQRAALAQSASALPDDGGRDSAATPDALRRAAVTRAELALARDPTDDHARYLRGRARLELWRTARPVAPDSLRALAEADLRAVTANRRDMAEAWSELSSLLQLTGNYEESRRAAETALIADAFLRNPETIVSRLHITALASGRTDEARAWCDRGRTQYPRDPRFWGCELTTLGWTASTPAEVAVAWQVLQESEARDSNNLLAAGWATRRLLVAAVAARAGLADSARSIVADVRANAPPAVPVDQIDYGEAYVRALLGETAAALPLLARYLRANPALRGHVRNTPWFASLHTNPAFLELTQPR